MSSNHRKNPEWAKIEKDCAKKRAEGKVQMRPKSASATKINYILSCQELTVQRLSAELNPGKTLKYSASGARVFVPYLEDDVTISGIKKACLIHFVSIDPSLKGSKCDVLASDRGPSCTNINQIPNLGLINVRFISQPIRTSVLYRSPFSLPLPLSSANAAKRSSEIQKNARSYTIKPSKSLMKSAAIPRSLTVSTMLKLGQTINESNNFLMISISEFKIHPEMCFNELGDFKFNLENDIFGRGAFRNVFKARCTSKPFNEGGWVVKRFNDEAMENIRKHLNQTLKQHTRKAVQMTSLSEYFASRLRSISSETPQFKYVKALFGEVKDSGEFVTIEELIPGLFEKYLNNDGKCADDSENVSNVNQLMAECLAHFSFEESKEKLLLTDIQGSKRKLTDPEIASAELFKNEEFLFCCGNFCQKAIKMFGMTHNCNTFCRAAQLKTLDKEAFINNYDDRIFLLNGEQLF